MTSISPATSIAVNSERDGKTNFLKSVNFWNHFPAAYNDLFSMQSDTKIFFVLQNVDVTRVAVVPHQVRNSMDKSHIVSACRDEHLLLVTE